MKIFIEYIIIILGICIFRKSNLIWCKKKDNLDSLSPSVNLIQSNPSLIENSVQGLSSNESDLFNNNLQNTKFNYSLIILFILYSLIILCVRNKL